MSRLNLRHPLSPAADRSLQFLPMEQTLQDLRDSRSLLLLRRIPTGRFQQPSPLSIDLPYLRQTIHFFRCPVPAPPFQEPMQSFLKILPQTVRPEFLPKTPPEKADLPVLLGFLYSRYHRPLHKRLPQKKSPLYLPRNCPATIRGRKFPHSRRFPRRLPLRKAPASHRFPGKIPSCHYKNRSSLPLL